MRNTLLLLLCLVMSRVEAVALVNKNFQPEVFYSRVEKEYQKRKYQKVLDILKNLNKEKYGKNRLQVKPLLTDTRFYHYKLSSLIGLGTLKYTTEALTLFDHLHRTDTANVYTNQPQYAGVRKIVREAADLTFKNGDYGRSKAYITTLARWGDTTDTYWRIFPRKTDLSIAHPEALREYLKKYDYTAIDQRAKAVKKQKTIEEQVTALTLDYTYDFEKARAIYVWIVHNISYDYSYKIYYAEPTFTQGKGVCQGYSYLFLAMCTAAGVKANLVTGRANNGRITDGHAWNMVHLQGTPFLIDSTWGVIPSNREYYYLIEEKELAKTHKTEKIW